MRWSPLGNVPQPRCVESLVAAPMNDLEFKVLFIDDDLNMQETVVSCLL